MPASKVHGQRCLPLTCIERRKCVLECGAWHAWCQCGTVRVQGGCGAMWVRVYKEEWEGCHTAQDGAMP